MRRFGRVWPRPMEEVVVERKDWKVPARREESEKGSVLDEGSPLISEALG